MARKTKPPPMFILAFEDCGTIGSVAAWPGAIRGADGKLLGLPQVWVRWFGTDPTNIELSIGAHPRELVGNIVLGVERVFNRPGLAMAVECVQGLLLPQLVGRLKALLTPSARRAQIVPVRFRREAKTPASGVLRRKGKR